MPALGCRRRRRMPPRSAWLQREMRQQFVPVRWRLRSERWAQELGCRLRRRWPGWVHFPLRPRPGPRRRRRLRRWRRRRRRRRMVPGCLLRWRGSGGWTSAPRCHHLSAYGLLWGAGLWAAAAAAEGGEAGEAGGRVGASEARGETTGDDDGDDDERRLSYRGREHR